MTPHPSKFIATISLALAASGCSVTLPVRGQLQNVDETFTGTATGYPDGSGSLSVLSSRGARCTGDFVYINSRQGEGVFNCSDGRSGPFRFTSTGTRGTGFGTLGNANLSFTFGD